MNRTRRYFLCTPLLAALPLTAATPLTMVVVDLMPWAGRNADGQLEGVAVDLAQQLSSLSGLPIVTRAVPYARAVAMLAGGSADLMLAIDAGQQTGLLPPLAPVGVEDIIIIGRRGVVYDNTDALCGRRVGLLRSASFKGALHQHPCLVRYPTNSYEQGLRMLRQGRLEAMAGARSTMDYAIRHLGLKPSDFGAPLVVGQAALSLYVAPSVLTPALGARLQQACQQLQRQKQMPALLAQYRQTTD
ncbi:transporter substrate-binding domain-containing protein [Duganella dendranthematis]|uniref:Transporter substrate-binding domain-containing protein n=1 Tax=Duganella dendranthematis TaxID=2728021 RepID=A0ABX6MFG2_9BURK|nr:transporter substrate-binding domain-containing protein [Duganella dendranthematis]QJD92674.1 transporter substrate-binding domain-containing protein [Duganella dendranthematis]